MEAVATADPPRRKGKTPRPRALPNEEVWRRLLDECADVHPFVMRWCDGDAGVAWHAMFSVGCLWIPGKGASFRSYVRSWSKLQAYRMHRGGGQQGRAQHMGYAILTEAQRVFGNHGADRDGRELLLQDVVEDDERAPDFNAEELAELAWALERLPFRERDILRWRFFEGRTMAVIAAERGISKQRVRQIEEKGLRRARGLIEGRRAAARAAAPAR